MKIEISFKKALYLILTFLPFLLTFILFPSLPEMIPMHYNFSGEIDRWGNRSEAFIFPTITIVMALFLQLSKLTKNAGTNAKTYNSINFGVIFTFNLLNFIFLYDSLHPTNLDSVNLVGAAISILFIALGNYCPKLKQNSFVGIRLPWTLKNEIVWNKTHRFGGFVWVIVGSIMLPLFLFVPSSYSSIILLVGLSILTIIPSVYSYIVYHKINDTPHK